MNAAILNLGLRSLLGRARVWLMIALPIVMIGLAAVTRAAFSAGAHNDAAAESFLRVFGVGIVVPIVALIATTTLINSEFDDGSIIYLLTKPISRVSIIASKALVVLGAGVVFAAVPMLLAGLLMVGGSSGVALSAFLGGVVATIAYVGIFTALATTMKRSVIGCLLYWLIWESTISSLLSPVKWLSARSWGGTVIGQLATAAGDGRPPVPVLYAVLAALIACAAGIALAGQRLASMTLSQE